MLFVVALFLYSAIGFTMLGLALNPLVRSLTRRDIEPVAWSTWTSLVLWVLVLTPLLATIVFYARNPGLLWIFSRWTAHGNEIRASSTSALVGMIPVLLATMALLGCVIIAALRRSPEAFSERKTAATAGVLILLVVIEAWWLYSRASSSSEYSHLLPVDALVGFSMTLVYSALRGWIVSRRVPMMGIGEHFLASVLGSCRAVALGSAALFVASLYIALPFHLQAVSFIEQYIAK